MMELRPAETSAYCSGRIGSSGRTVCFTPGGRTISTKSCGGGYGGSVGYGSFGTMHGPNREPLTPPSNQPGLLPTFVIDHSKLRCRTGRLKPACAICSHG